MQSVESEGESIDEAIRNALHLLQAARDRVEIEILSDATTGVFGLGRKKARVRATLRPSLWQSADAPGSASEAPAVSRGTTTTPARSTPAGSFDDRCIVLLRELISHIGVSCPITSRPGPDGATLVVEATGDGSALLIGRRGQTLDAIEYLVNRMVARSDEDEGGRVVIDVEGYRGRRQEYLE